MTPRPTRRGRRRGRAAAALAGGVLGLLALGSGCNRVEVGRTAATPEAEAPAAATADRPNVLLVTIDTLRADHVGAWGADFAHTPTLDALAAEGVRFETAVASGPLTLPSHATILTGRYPPRTGVRHNGIHVLPASATTLAERLGEAGWATAAVVGAAVLEARYGLDQGFDRYDDAREAGRASGPAGFLERPASVVTDRALAWVADAPRPFFLWVHYFDPHGRYRPPEPWAARFADRPYDGEVAYADAELGRLLAGLGAEVDGTLVAVTADHGESLGEHGEATHSYTLYDAVLHVPMLLRGPGWPRGRVVAGVTRTADLAPTLLGRLGLPPLPGTDGVDLGPLLRAAADGSSPAPTALTATSATAPPRGAYAETLATRIEHGWAPLFAWRTRDHLFVDAPRPELYDVRADPAQRHDRLAADEPGARETAGRLAAELAVHRHAGAAAGSTVAGLDAATRERLAALGYALPEGEVAGTGVDPKDGLRSLDDLHAGLAAYDAGRLAEAAAILERAREVLPASSRLLSTLAHAHLRLGRPERALEPIRAAVRHAPANAGYHAVQGDVHRQLGEPEAAEAAYRRAAALDPAEPLARIGLAWVEARAGRIARAEREAEVALARDAGTGTLVRLGLVWEGTGHPGRARALFARAVEADPGHRVARVLLASALLAAGDASGAAPHLEAAGALAHHPRYAARLERARAIGGWRGAAAEAPVDEPVR